MFRHVLPNLTPEEVKEAVCGEHASCLVAVRRARDVLVQHKVKAVLAGRKSAALPSVVAWFPAGVPLPAGLSARGGEGVGFPERGEESGNGDEDQGSGSGSSSASNEDDDNSVSDGSWSVETGAKESESTSATTVGGEEEGDDDDGGGGDGDDDDDEDWLEPDEATPSPPTSIKPCSPILYGGRHLVHAKRCAQGPPPMQQLAADLRSTSRSPRSRQPSRRRRRQRSRSVRASSPPRHGSGSCRAARHARRARASCSSPSLARGSSTRALGWRTGAHPAVRELTFRDLPCPHFPCPAPTFPRSTALLRFSGATLRNERSPASSSCSLLAHTCSCSLLAHTCWRAS